jgi:uncharacterized protein YndB with AHSA1/START domain
MPRHAAVRTLVAPLDDVWAFLAEPYNLSDWWPGIGGLVPDRRGVAPGARWAIRGSDLVSAPFSWPGIFRRPGAAGILLVTDVVPRSRLAFQLVDERISAEIELSRVDPTHTEVTVSVEAPWVTVRRSYARKALNNLYDLVQTGATP